MKGSSRLWRLILVWVERPVRRNIRDSEALLILLCAPLGALVGLVVVAMHEAVAALHWFNFGVRIDETLSSGLSDIAPWRLAVVPAAGGLLLGLIAVVMHKIRPNEIVDPIEANALYGGRLSLLDSARLAAQTVVSNGVGASLGMEAAFSQIGAGILSVAGQRLRLRRADLRVFVGAGTAAAIAAAFNAPLAGSFYAFELIMGSYAPAALAQVAMASLAGTMVMRATVGTAPIFIVNAPVMIFHQWEYPLFAVVGVGAAMVGIATMRTAVWCESALRRLHTSEWLRPALGGALLSALALPFPHVLGSGHGAIQWLFDSAPELAYLAMLLVAKIVATAISIGSGFRGGLFSASLFLGCLFGDVVARLAGDLAPEYAGEHTVLMVVGMGAVAASIVGAPVTMVLLALEVTGDFNVALAVLAGVVLAATITRFRFGYSFATWRFHQRGKPIRSGYDIGWLVELTVGSIMHPEATTVGREMPLMKLRAAAPLGSNPIIFATDAAGNYAGMIDLTVVHDPELDDAAAGLVAGDLAESRHAYLLPQTDIRAALGRFEETETEILPVLASEEERKVIGFVSEAYALKRFAHEMERAHNAQLGERDLFNIWPVK
jgi:CIC family chloride channel protein